MQKKINLFISLLIAGILHLHAQQLLVTGTVTDKNSNEAIIGASIVIEGTTIGHVTDIDGKIELQASVGNILNISYIGYKAQSIRIDDRQKHILIDLEEDTQAPDAIVVVGFGTQKKVNLSNYLRKNNSNMPYYKVYGAKVRNPDGYI